MKLRNVRIENFRGIKSLDLDLDDTTVLIGENNAGKTAILEALRLCIRELGTGGRIVFDEFDFHLKDERARPTDAPPIQITVRFFDDKSEPWSDELVSRLTRAKVLQVNDAGINHVTLRVSCDHEETSREIRQRWEFLNLDDNPLTVPDSALGAVQTHVAFFYLAALRDASRHFDAKGQYWRPFLKDSQIPQEKKDEIEKGLKALNDLVISSHTSFEQATAMLQRVQEAVPMGAGNIVDVEAVPGRIFDMLSKAQVHLGTVTGAKIPIGRHGDGTQSLAVLMLFSAYLSTWARGTPFVAMEEPEAHLHPSAVRSMWKLASAIDGQKLISTHSGDLLSEVPVGSLRRICRGPNGVEVHRLKMSVKNSAGRTVERGTLDDDEERKFNFHIRQARGELLFARCWLLVEGETELTLLPELARHLGIDLERAGVRCVQHRHCGSELFMKVARDLGIKFCILADNDSQGAHDQKHARAYAPSNITDVLHVMPEADVEGHLCASGFGAIYESYLSPQKRANVTAAPGDPDYWPQLLSAIKKNLVKPEAALKVVEEIRRGQPAPALFEQVLRSACALSEGN